MAIKNSNVSYSGLVEKYIGTAYDTVKVVADNIEHVVAVGKIDGIEDIAQDIEDAVALIEEETAKALEAAIQAEASAAAAKISEDAADIDATAATAAAIQTANDVVKTNADVVKTNNDVVTTNANAAQTSVDVAQTQADAIQTGLDSQQTQADVVTSAVNATDAQNAADSAEISWDTFDDMYLGPKATPPSVDNDGDTLQTGALYLATDVVPMLMKFWDGVAWLNAFSVTDELNHAALTGLLNDDHTQYLNVARHDAIAGNPHSVVKAEVGLGSVDDTADVDKPVSTATQTALDLKENGLGTPTAEGDALVSTVAGVRSWLTLATPSDLNNGLATKEDNLGNPSTDGQMLSSTAAGTRSWIDVALDFLGLSDTPATYVGQAGKPLVVSVTEDSLEFGTLSSSAIISATPPGAPVDGAQWFNSDRGQLYIWYTSPNNGASQWIKDNINIV